MSAGVDIQGFPSCIHAITSGLICKSTLVCCLLQEPTPYHAGEPCGKRAFDVGALAGRRGREECLFRWMRGAIRRINL